jgi:hypothetical protein
MITEFTVDYHKTPKVDQRLNSDYVKFKRPDFGFNDYMTFDENEYDALSGWNKLIPLLSIFPKYERVNNYINFIQEKKR